jgi:hypothetical protein
MSLYSHDLEIYYTLEYPDKNQIDMGDLTLNFSLNLASHLVNQGEIDYSEDLTIEDIDGVILQLLEDNIVGSWDTWDYKITPAIDLEAFRLEVQKEIDLKEHWDWVEVMSEAEWIDSKTTY